MNKSKLITILGPTASGKTSLAVRIASTLKGEIVSADSRQVYRGMDIGSGKDLAEYRFNGDFIQHHLIDILPAGEKYSVYKFKEDCEKAVEKIISVGRRPILCGGTGMYLDSILFDYKLPKLIIKPELKKTLDDKSMEELVELLAEMKPLHNTSDTTDRERLIKAIEIASLEKKDDSVIRKPENYGIVFGLRGERDLLKCKIEDRLKFRLENGLIAEVEGLMSNGLNVETLVYYGLEYKLVALYLNNELNYNDMYQKLRSAIFQFSKRQMTWFRRMERNGIKINWLDIENGEEANYTTLVKMTRTSVK